jgi:hypothetical protein
MRFRALHAAGGCRPQNVRGTLGEKRYPLRSSATRSQFFTCFYSGLAQALARSTIFAFEFKEAVMNSKRIGAYLILCSLVVTVRPFPALAQQSSDAPKPNLQQAPAERDGQHDFDPLIGSWKYHLKRRLHPLTGSTTWVEFDGTGVCRKVYDGASIDQIEVGGPTGHIEGLTLRVYNPQSHQWRLYWANSKIGILDPPQVGQFKDGHGQFFAQDTINGKTILIRFDWTNLTTNSPHFEQSFSDDGGRTWEVNWITDQTRVPDESDKAH